jgi:hypothetical protein
MAPRFQTRQRPVSIQRSSGLRGSTQTIPAIV